MYIPTENSMILSLTYSQQSLDRKAYFIGCSEWKKTDPERIHRFIPIPYNVDQDMLLKIIQNHGELIDNDKEVGAMCALVVPRWIGAKMKQCHKSLPLMQSLSTNKNTISIPTYCGWSRGGKQNDCLALSGRTRCIHPPRPQQSLHLHSSTAQTTLSPSIPRAQTDCSCKVQV
jgi:hypothetical protein